MTSRASRRAPAARSSSATLSCPSWQATYRGVVPSFAAWSMLAFAVPYGHGDRRDQVYSLSARLLPWEVTRGSERWHDYFPGGKAHFEYYSKAYGLAQVHFGEDIRAAENMEFISQGSVNNALCFVGPHRVYSQWSNTFFELCPGQGHFGPDALPGVSALPMIALSLFLETFVTQAILTLVSFPYLFSPCRRMPAGAAARRSRSRPRATRWSASRRRRTRRWSSRSARPLRRRRA
mgnify:CR=1 FL=1